MFFIIDGDKPIYELSTKASQQELRILLDLHSSLDNIDYLTAQKKQCFLGFVSFDNPAIICQTTPTNLKMILVLNLLKKQCTKQVEDRIKGFFERVTQYLGIAIMNPLYTIHNQITSTIFDSKVRDQMTKRLGTLIERK